jgi:type IV secretory pathway VirB10-like protein
MRAATLLSLLIPAALGAGLGLSLVSCHKEKLPQAKAKPPAAERRLKLEAYDPVIPKAPPPAQKLDTAAPHPQLAQAAPEPAPAEAPPPPVRRQRPDPPVQSYAGQDYARQAPPPRPRQTARVYAYAEPGSGRYVEARRAGDYAPDDPRGDAPPEPSGFRLTVKMCRNAARQGDPLADTQECQGMLQAARVQAELCARAFEAGDDSVVLSAACRQAALARYPPIDFGQVTATF